MHLPYAKPPYHTELAPTERPFRWPRRPRDNQRPSKFLVLLPISWFSIGQKNRPTPSSQPKSWCSCQPPDTIWFTTIMTQPAANKDPETAASCQIFHDLLRSWPNQQPAKTLMLLSAANSPMSHDNWPPPAAMEHGKAPGRPQALLKKDSESDKKMVLGVVGLGFLWVSEWVSESITLFYCGKT